EWAFVLYTVPGAPVYHQRRVVGCRRGACSATELGRVLIATPDLDVYEEDYRAGSMGADIARVVFSPTRWPPPATVPRAQVYRFRDEPTGQEYAAMRGAARAEAERLWVADDRAAGGPGAPIPDNEFVPFESIAGVMAGAGGAAGPGAAAAGAAPAGAVVPLAAWPAAPAPIAGGPAPGLALAPAPPAAAAPAAPVAVGALAAGAAAAAGAAPQGRPPAIPDGLPIVVPANGMAPHGLELVALLPSGHSVFVALVADTEIEHLKREFRGSDARTLPVVRTAIGRERSWASVVTDCREEEVQDFGVKAPRSVKWCAAYQQRDGGPVLHSEMWRSRRRLQDSDFGVAEHETLSKVVELLGTTDQVDIYNLAGVEVAYRKPQLIEYYWDERRQEPHQANSKLPLDEVQAFMGVGRAASMVRPEVLDQVAKELERIAGIKKNARKLREEQAALAKK
ncbi:unnamed protein product, partial [Prorocentrum cordatum]